MITDDINIKHNIYSILLSIFLRLAIRAELLAVSASFGGWGASSAATAPSPYSSFSSSLTSPSMEEGRLEVLVRLVPLLVEVNVIAPAELDVILSGTSCARAPSTSPDRRWVSDEAEASPSLVVSVLGPALSGGGAALKSTLPPSPPKLGFSERPASFSGVSF